MYALIGEISTDLFSTKEEAQFQYFILRDLGLSVRIKTLNWKILG